MSNLHSKIHTRFKWFVCIVMQLKKGRYGVRMNHVITLEPSEFSFLHILYLYTFILKNGLHYYIAQLWIFFTFTTYNLKLGFLKFQKFFSSLLSTIEVEIPKGRIGLNYLSKFVWTQWAVWLMYSSSWILVGWKFYCLTNSYASSIYANLCTVLTSDEKPIL